MEKTKVTKRKAATGTAKTTTTTTAKEDMAARLAKCAPEANAAPSAEVDDPREWDNRRASAQATRAANARQISGRRRFVDPTTCEREYSQAEMEFMHAMHDYKQSSGRMFPTWSEVLEVIKALGYEKMVEPDTSTATTGKVTAATRSAQTA